ncbi:MAG: pilin [Candidatus Staskawiczbacteria bacterium]|jgi:hypothetical protein
MLKFLQKNKACLILFSTLFLGFANLASALEVTNGPCSNSDNLGQCVVNIFDWGIGIAAIIASVSFAIGAVTFMLSGDSGERSSSGKDRMKGAVLGLVLLGASFLIMKTINPILVNPDIDSLDEVELETPPRTPGIYFYPDASCDKTSLYYSNTSLENIGAEVNGIEIVNDLGYKYGVVLHKTPGLGEGGDCLEPILDEGCHSTDNFYGAIDIFSINPKPITSGTGVEFYSEAHGLDKGSRGGHYLIKAEDMTGDEGTPGLKDFEWDGSINDIQKQECPDFKTCPGSMDVKGSFFVAVYSDSKEGGLYCQTFTDKVAEFNAEPVVHDGDSEITKVTIFPTN